MFDVKNIKRYYRLGLRKIRTFLLSDKFRECLIFLFFCADFILLLDVADAG